jgi:hypothetical protein
VRSYQCTQGDLFHHLNLVELETRASRHSLLMLRLSHPAAPTHRFRAAEVTAHEDFQRIVQSS